MSPEILEGVKNSEAGFKRDIWALGCILYELASLRRPFDPKDTQMTFRDLVINYKPLRLSRSYSRSLRYIIC